MKKYWFLTLLAALMIVALTGCGATGGAETAPQSADTDSVAQSSGMEDALALVGDFTTTRYFTDEAVAEEDIEQILLAGVNTASASNRQPWHFTAVTSSNVLQDVLDAVNARREANGQAPLPEPEPGKAVETYLARIPLLIVVSVDEGAELNAGLAVQNMAVMAQLLGYGTKIETSPASAVNDNLETLGRALGIPEVQRAAAVIKIGKPDVSVDETLDGFTAATGRNPLDEVTTRVTAPLEPEKEANIPETVEPEPLAEVKEEMVEVNGVSLSVKEAGSGSDMVLIHGRGFNKESMDILFQHYQNQYHVVSYDVRGHGETVAPGEFTLDDLSDDLAGLISAYHLEKPIVVGFSMGSYITLKTAEKYPGLLSKIVLIGTRGGRTTSGMELTDEVARALDSFDILTNAPQVSVPALVLTGENDAINPPVEGESVADALPDARFEVIEDAEHMAYVGQPDRVLELIDAFLSD